MLVPCDDQDRVLPQALERTLQAVSGPTIIAVECGNVNTGAFGERLMRISVSDWATDTDDVDRVVEAPLHHAERANT